MWEKFGVSTFFLGIAIYVWTLKVNLFCPIIVKIIENVPWVKQRK